MAGFRSLGIGEGDVGRHARLQGTVRVVHQNLHAEDQVEPVGRCLDVARCELGVLVGRRHDAAERTAGKRVDRDRHRLAHLDVPELVKRGLLVENEAENTYQLLSPSLEKWILKEIQAPASDQASKAAISEWLSAAGGGQSLSLEGLLGSFKDKYWSVVAGLPEDVAHKLTVRGEKSSEGLPLEEQDLRDYVFVCYSRNEKAFVDQLVADLNANGVKTWRDVDNIPGSRQSNLRGWRKAIEHALDGCGAMLIVLSSGAVDSQEVEAEWNHFASKKRPIYPIIVKECSVPFFLKIYQIWDLSADYSNNVVQLAEVLKSIV